MTTHVFIVDAITFKYHLEYMFVGTGMKDSVIDFNNSPTTQLAPQTENTILGMVADFSRVQIGDLIIFYLQQNFQFGIGEGKFFGVFKVRNKFFFDNNDEQQYLKQELNKSLTFRCLIEPEKVYSKGVTEWEALDEIKTIQSPNQMLWSLIYRKLKGNRDNTVITIYESERLISLIRDKNLKQNISGNYFSFNLKQQEIIPISTHYTYEGRQEQFNILPRMIYKYSRNNQFEAHLQAYILQSIYETKLFGILENQPIEWLGNEVSCGVGMQRIDIMLSLAENPRKIIPIELKSTCVYTEILGQIQRYIDWLEQYYIPNRPSDIQPMIICRETTNKNSTCYQDFYQQVRIFNEKNNILPIMYVEFKIQDCFITFNQVF
ncbi:PDDEXK family nuclease [Helicobacter mesocricetorum]|uniref:DUF91 domain-containing protein n=1 Tax=Helicobacter mesocricetorum TaxID=87012 RepID=UPI000CF0824F|nr:DUF91 domain-containing protein [Helicobacter mesocricetorum]